MNLYRRLLAAKERLWISFIPLSRQNCPTLWHDLAKLGSLMEFRGSSKIRKNVDLPLASIQFGLGVSCVGKIVAIH